MYEKQKITIWLIIIVIVVIVGTWISGYSEASKMVEAGNASILTVGIKARDMNGIKKSGFRFYLDHNTDYNSRIDDLNNL